MPSYTFDAPENHQLEIDGKIVAKGGESFSCTAEKAAALAAQGINVGESVVDLNSLGRQALDKLAGERGLDLTAYKNKTELVEALEQPIADHLTADDQPPANPQD